MLIEDSLEHILSNIPRLIIGVVGDLFLDRYLDLDAALTETSLETGLDAYQVVAVRSYPGAAGTVINNLVALGVRRVCPVAVIGDDGEGYELRQALDWLGSIDPSGILIASDRRTPTYTKPLLRQAGQLPRELNRLDIKNRSPLPRLAEDWVLRALTRIWPQVDALLVIDQVSEANCGVVTSRVREQLAELGEAYPDKLILVDSRERIGLYRQVSAKPNERECWQALVSEPTSHGPFTLEGAVRRLVERLQRPVFCTAGEQGIHVGLPESPGQLFHVPAYPVAGPIDPVGAGDSTSAGIACALASGASPLEAAAFGNLVASITIEQLGTTGTATPKQVRQRWHEHQVSC